MPQKTTLGKDSWLFLGLYRDVMKAVAYMSDNPNVRANIRKVFRKEFEKQRSVKTKEEHEKFREGMMRILGNFLYEKIRVWCFKWYI